MSSVEPPPRPPAPKVVSRFEASLLRILRFFFDQAPAEEAMQLVRTPSARPKCLSPAAVALVRDTLAKGCVLYLVRAGGWKIERFLHAGQPKSGRLWQRSHVDELKLEFSKHSLEFLIWLTCERPSESGPIWFAPADELTIADKLLFFLAYKSLREQQDVAAALRTSPNIVDNALCRLFYPADFAADDAGRLPSVAEWFTGMGSLVLEALQSLLESNWLEIERGKGQQSDWERMRQQGEAERAVLGRFLDMVDQTKRWDLARFLLGVLAKVLAAPEMTPTFWTGGLRGSGPTRLAERLAAQRSALSLLQTAERFRGFAQRARHSGYFDEDYAASQFWLGEWERLNGLQVTARAERIVQLLEPLSNPPKAETA